MAEQYRATIKHNTGTIGIYWDEKYWFNRGDYSGPFTSETQAVARIKDIEAEYQVRIDIKYPEVSYHDANRHPGGTGIDLP